MNNVYFGDELRLVKLVLLHAELRSQYQSLELGRFISKPVNDILSKILSVQYFKSSAVDLNYIYEKCETLGLDPLTFADFRDQVLSMESREIDFFSIVDEIKTRTLKSQSIPILLSEYEKLVRADNEMAVTASLTNINEKIKAAIGRQLIITHDEDDIRRIEDRIKFYTGVAESSQRRFFTGYEAFDSLLGGFATSELCVFMGAPSVGKTVLLINLAYSIWEKANVNVQFYTLEMPISQITRRFDARIFQIDSNLLRAGGLKDIPTAMIDNIKNRTNALAMFDLPPQSTVTDLEENFLKSEVKPDVIVIDYAGLMRTKSKYGASIGEIADEVSLSLKYMAKKYKISIITAIQVTGEATRKSTDTQESYAIFDAAGGTSFGRNSDILCGIKFDPNLNIMSFESPKNRDGEKFSFQLFMEPKECRLFEIQ